VIVTVRSETLGLSSYAKEPSAASVSIQKLLAFIKTIVPQEQWKKTPIQVHATAGLRSVTPAEASAVLDVVRDELSVSDFLFEPHWARVISGEQEGINGWMAVNYLLGVFDKAGKSDVSNPPASTGVVEMGGSSMQITFSPSNPSIEERKQLNEVIVAGHRYWLYTHSFLQYGLQAAEKLYQKLSISEIEEKGNPCYPPNFRHSSVGDFDKCTVALNAVVDKSIACAAASCSFNGVYQPRIGSEEFLAIENFYYTAKFFGTALEQDQITSSTANSAEAKPSGNQVVDGLRRKGQ
jgi:Golgi nucleoside diphosphatase